MTNIEHVFAITIRNNSGRLKSNTFETQSVRTRMELNALHLVAERHPQPGIIRGTGDTAIK